MHRTLTETAKVYFWPYDIFGYLFPGLLLTGFLLIIDNIQAWLIQITGEGIPYWLSILVISYVIGHIISACSSLLLERLILRKLLGGYPTIYMFSNEFNKSINFITEFLAYYRPYSTDFQQQFVKLFRRRFKLNNFDHHDIFHLTWQEVAIQHPIAFKRATHFLELYGFTRNMSLTIFALGIFSYIHFDQSIITTILITSLILSLILFYNYAKLLRRMHDEIFRAFVSVQSANSEQEHTT